MTNEEAIEILNNWSPWQEIGDYDRFRDALDMAIKALEQQPSEDCISRQAVNTLVDELARAISDERCFISRGRSTADIMQDILDLPSVTPSYNLEPYSDKLWKNAYERGKADVLDKIREEIEQTASRYTISRERDAMGKVEWSDILIKESEVLQIIDKYKAESEDAE